MIDIDKLTPEDEGRWVKYVRPHCTPELGKILRWSRDTIFVVYHCNNKWNEYYEYTAAGTDPEDLKFVGVT